MAVNYEPGCFGSLVSLGGILGGQNRGRKIEMLIHSTPATGAQVLGSNPRRIAAIIQNRSAVTLNVFFDYTTIACTLLPGENLQIDKDFPWTGEVFVQNAAGANPVYTIELSVQQ